MKMKLLNQLESMDKKYLWHPFTQMKDWIKNDILIIQKGRGSYLFDTNGKKYLDGVSSLWCNVHGHNKKELNYAIRKQLDNIAHSTLLGLANVPSIELAGELIKIAPKGLQKVFYSDSGATAVEIAIKIAYQYWKQNNAKRTKFLTFSNAYHGDTIGSVSLGGIDAFHELYKSLLFKTIKAPAPYCYRCSFGRSGKTCRKECLREIEKIIRARRNVLAGLIIEPLIQGAAGMLTQPKGFIRRLRELCGRYDILMIVDEVATGFGRTGKMFACEHEKITPDIMTVAKGITGGYLPLAATLTTEKVFNAFLGDFKDGKTFYHGHTYTGNPLACSAALANLEIFSKEKVMAKLQPKIKYLKEKLAEFYKLAHVGDIRQCGFMAGIELVKNKSLKEPYPPEKRIGHQVILEARKQDVILRPLGDVVVLMPPLSISMNELKKLLDATYKSIQNVTEAEQDRVL